MPTRGWMIAVIPFLIGTEVGAASVRVRKMPGSPVTVARATAGPAGTLTCLDWKTHGLRVVTAQGAESKLNFAISAGARITNIGGGDGQMLVTTAQHGTYILASDGSVRARFEMSRFTPYIAAATDRDTAFGMGSAADESGRIRADWLVTRVNVKAPSAVPRELVTDDGFADPFARSIYPLGYLLLSADRSTLYALWEGSPLLYVVPTAGGSVRTITLTSGADAPPRATPQLRSSVIMDRNGFYLLRSKYRWPQGLLRGPGDSFAILFREPASRGNSFTIDLYSRQGKAIGSNLAVDIQPRSPTAQARAVTTTDGQQYIIVNEPNNDDSGATEQHVYAIDIRP